MLLFSVWLCGIVCAAYGDENDDLQREALQNPLLFGGDMLGVELDENRNVKANLLSRWPNGIVPYRIAPGLTDANSTDIIKKAMDHYHSTTCVKFVPHTNQRNFVNIFQGKGCYSNVGMTNGLQTIALGKGCINVGTVVHELGHVLGVYHEHNRSDRDEYLDMHLENIKEGQEIQFQKLTPEQNLLLTPFNYDSIMMYSNEAFATKKGLHTMTAKNGQVLLDPYRKKGMTALDIKRINMMYNCKN